MLRTLIPAALLASTTPFAVYAQDNVERSADAEATRSFAESEGLAPVGEWIVESGQSGCAAARTFADGSERVTLVMRRLQPMQEFQFAVIGSHFSHEDELSAGFAPSGRILAVGDLNRASQGERTGFVFARHTFVEQAALPEVERMWGSRTQHFVIEGEDRAPLLLRTGPISDVLSRIDACTLEQLGTYGVDIANLDSLTRRPQIVKLNRLVHRLQRAYGRDAESIFSRGGVSVRLIVDAEGQVQRCDHVTQMARRDLERITCDVFMDRAEFEPALDAAGRPVTGVSFQNLAFVAVLPANADGS